MPSHDALTPFAGRGDFFLRPMSRDTACQRVARGASGGRDAALLRDVALPRRREALFSRFDVTACPEDAAPQFSRICPRDIDAP